ncbi:hypothetical protein [Shimia sp.]|uniref:hypothetical protein n=1 Tax=Shimia sp. TaxID=1954381 RepID=UPI0032990D73
MRILSVLLLAAQPALADPPMIEAAKASGSGTNWRFDVTLSHPDTGWDHYADGWRVEDADGNVLGLRVLTHPHEHEQPFTRSLSGVAVPASATTVFIRSRCIVDGWSDETYAVTLD